jgi:hypothetical protein
MLLKDINTFSARGYTMGMFHHIYSMYKHDVVFEVFRGNDAKHTYQSRFIFYSYALVTLIFNLRVI